MNLRAARKRAGISTSALARRSGVARAHVTRIEQGKASPTLVTLEKLASALGCVVALVPTWFAGRATHGGSWHIIDVDRSDDDTLRAVCGHEAPADRWELHEGGETDCEVCS